MEGVAEDRFDVVRKLGAGGFGVVYEAVDRERGQRVALKTLARVEASALYRFKHEFRALAEVAHENLVRLHELLCVGDRWSFTMELVDGVDFLQWVWKTDDVSPTDATLAAPAPIDAASARATPRPTVDVHRLRDAARQMARGIAALHAKNLVHRDLKPSNVLVDRAGRVVIVDFGIAKQFGDNALATATNALVGTPAYMAPEQSAAGEIGPAADWYAFGIMLFEALTGRLPFLGTPLQILGDKHQFDPPRVRELVPDAPEDLDVLCADLLRRDPTRRPDQGEVLRRLGDAPISKLTPSSTPGSARLVSREKELAALESSFERVSAGDGAVVIVRGTSGMGKTALVRRFLEIVATRDSAVVLEGRCYERESVPYKGFDGVIDALVRELLRMPKAHAAALTPRHAAALARVFPVLARAEHIDTAPRLGLDVTNPHEVRARAFGALRELLARLADRRPVVVFIDDLQWGDTDSVALLGELTAPPNAPAILTIVGHSAEDSETSAPLRAMVDRRARPHLADAPVIDVGPLPRDAAEELARELLGDSSAAVAPEIAAESGGSPFFVGELVRSYQSDPSRPDALRIDRIVEERVRELPDEARSILELIAVAGRPVDRKVIMSAMELDGDVTARAIATLRLGHLIRVAGSGAGIECFHDRVREGVLRTLADEVVRGRHNRLARALITSGDADPERLFIHFRGAGDVARAAEYAEAAARRAEGVLAFEQAAELLRFAVDAEPKDSERRDALLVALGEALSSSGRCAEAAECYLSARPASANQAVALRTRAAQNLLYGGLTDRGVEVSESVLHEFGMRLPRSSLGALLGLIFLRLLLWIRGLDAELREAKTIDERVLAQIDACFAVGEGLALVDAVKAQLFGQRAVLLALRTGERVRVCRALVQEAGFRIAIARSGSDVARAFAACARAEALLATDPPVPEMKAIAAAGRAWVHFFAAEWQNAVAAVDTSIELNRRSTVRNRWYHDMGVFFSDIALVFLGRLAELQRRFPGQLREATDLGDLYLQTNLRCGITTSVYWLIRDEPAVLRENVADALARWSRSGFQVQHFYGIVSLAQADLYEGRPHDAVRRIEEQLPIVRRSGLLTAAFTQAMLWSALARALVAVAAVDRNRASITAAERAIRRLGKLWLPWARAIAQMLDGIVARVCGDDARAVSSLRGAAAQFDSLDMRLFAETARTRLGAIVGGDDGAAMVKSSLEWLASEGVRSPEQFLATWAPDPERR